MPLPFISFYTYQHKGKTQIIKLFAGMRARIKAMFAP